MPLFIGALLGGLVNIAATLAGRVLVALGFSLITYTGVLFTLTFLKSQAVASFTGLTPQVISLLMFMQVGKAISIIFSAIVLRATFNGLSPVGSITRLALGHT